MLALVAGLSPTADDVSSRVAFVLFLISWSAMMHRFEEEVVGLSYESKTIVERLKGQADNSRHAKPRAIDQGGRMQDSGMSMDVVSEGEETY